MPVPSVIYATRWRARTAFYAAATTMAMLLSTSGSSHAQLADAKVLTADAVKAVVLRAQDASTLPKTSGKWAANIAQLDDRRGDAEITVAPRNDKESRAKLSLRAVPINRQAAWDIVAGRRGDDGRPVAAAAAFRQVLSRDDGSGDGMANIPLLEPGKQYYVRVFAPGTVPVDRGGFGCANLSEVP